MLTDPLGMNATPLARVSKPVIACVVLTVHDLAGVGDFYQRVIGLPRLGGDAEHLLLGHAGQFTLELRRDLAARRRLPSEAGLFHTAFLMPSRADLGTWMIYAASQGVHLDGASDHIVSEAMYLQDPEGNGIEVYADRAAESWTWRDGEVVMATRPLDRGELQAYAAERQWRGAPGGSTIGHVHLQVGALEPAQAFYCDTLRLDVTCRYPGAVFYAIDGYHHHVATNIWNSRNAGIRSLPSTGLTQLSLRLPEGPVSLLADPWGTPIAITRE